MIRFGAPRPRRRPNLTPMIDVVFLLLVFFMLVSRFGIDRALPLVVGGGSLAYAGPPRLVEVRPEGQSLNGVAILPDDLAPALARLMQTPQDTVVLRAAGGADLQRLVDVMQALSDAGFARLALVEGSDEP